MAVAFAPTPRPLLEEPLPESLEPVDWRLAAPPAARARRLRPPRVLTREEVRRLVAALRGTPRLAARLVYGSGLRVEEVVGLRAEDVDFPGLAITVRASRRAVARRTFLQPAAIPSLRRLLEVARELAARDLSRGLADPGTRVGRGFLLFPSPHLARDPRTGRLRRPPLDPRRIERAVARTARALGLPRGTGCRALRASFAAHLLDAGWSPARVRALLGHAEA
jgi:integrase